MTSPTNPNDWAGSSVPRRRRPPSPLTWGTTWALAWVVIGVLVTAAIVTLNRAGCEYAIRANGHDVKTVRGDTLDAARAQFTSCTDIVVVGEQTPDAIVLDEMLGSGWGRSPITLLVGDRRYEGRGRLPTPPSDRSGNVLLPSSIASCTPDGCIVTGDLPSSQSSDTSCTPLEVAPGSIPMFSCPNLDHSPILMP